MQTKRRQKTPGPDRPIAVERTPRTNHGTYWPYNGDASFYSIVVDGGRSENAVWTYEKPHEAIDEIKGFVSFYPDRLDAIETF